MSCCCEGEEEDPPAGKGPGPGQSRHPWWEAEEGPRRAVRARVHQAAPEPPQGPSAPRSRATSLGSGHGGSWSGRRPRRFPGTRLWVRGASEPVGPGGSASALRWGRVPASHLGFDASWSGPTRDAGGLCVWPGRPLVGEAVCLRREGWELVGPPEPVAVLFLLPSERRILLLPSPPEPLPPPWDPRAQETPSIQATWARPGRAFLPSWGPG
eukprot:TsM_000084900 transcript=TsM_000084900 gene=TsM_000084900